MAKRASGKVNQHGVEMGMKAYETRGLTDADVDKILEIREDNTEAFKAALNEAVARGLEKIGLAAEGHAKARCPVDTGRLRNSITHAQLDKTDSRRVSRFDKKWGGFYPAPPAIIWSGRLDSNQRPSAPKADALPSCATPRTS